MLTPRIMKLHRNIDHDWQMTPIDFQVTRIMKLYRYIDNDWQMTPNNFQITRSKVKVTVTRNTSFKRCGGKFVGETRIHE
ncbi:hypothetical protein DPMN_075018 [Dreissena polymorpha]|uniref:Uncharacterized protein n=1 Tax=Dreissena polymorpha TaxID=45954 RepID=A0A9D4BNZ9_DREPO|nr:hypothetical protein DPMN_075018 [Dreissena polymorpha]